MIHTPVCDLLGITHPIVLGGMASGTSVPLVTAVSNAGGLGTLGVTGLNAAHEPRWFGRIVVHRAPAIHAQARLLSRHVANALAPRRVCGSRHQALATDILIGPDRPAGAVLLVDVKLVLQQVVSLIVASVTV